MKYLNKFLIVLVIGGLAACSSFTDDLDRDPNRLIDVDAAQILQGPILADMLFHAGEASRLAGLWDNHFTGQDRQYVGLMNWNSITGGDMDSPWGTAYYGVLKQARVIQSKTDDNLKLKGAAQVLEAHIMGTVTSLWGDVPYSEAANDAEFPNPAYDSQTAVYAGIQATLDQAIANLAGVGAISASADIYYGGDAAKWTRLAHSLKARYYLHVGNYAAAKTSAQLGINSAAGDLIAPFGGSYGNSFNPYYDFMVYNRSGYMGARDAYAPTIMDPDGSFANTYGGYNRNHAKHDEGARFYYNYHYYEIYTAGYEPNYLNGFDWSCEDCGKFGEEFPLVTYGEMLLIIAEADARASGLTAGVTSYNVYRALIDGGYGFNDNVGETSSWSFPAYVDADFSPGGVEDQGSTASSPVNALLREIYEERYLYLSGITETWTDMRRTNNIAEIQLKPTYTGVPERFVIAQSEINANTNTPDGFAVTVKTEVHGGN